jgi:predicted neutral ceramidase superfamily lipid hydrolase
LILDALMPVALYGGMFVFYCIEGRFAKYFPTISETGTGEPNGIYSGVIFLHVGTTSFFNRLCLIIFCFSCYRPHFLLIVGLIVFSIGSFAGNVGLAALPVNVDPPSHFIAATCCFACTIAFQFVLVLVDIRAEDTVATLGEWLYVAGLLLFWPTFIRELATCEIVGIVKW